MTTKRKCSKCLKTKLTSEFHKHKYGRDGLRSRCKQCNRDEAREFYNRKPALYIERAMRFKKKRHKERKQFIAELKARLGCQLCPERDPVVLDFHHVNPRQHDREKTMVIGRAANFSDKVFNGELKKCVVICANCHRKVHTGRVAIPEGLNCFLEERHD